VTVRASVIVSAYNQPAWLEKVLWGYAHQTTRAFELIIADDGSTAETEAVVVAAARRFQLRLVHVWHEDRGFRKTAILNRALQVAGGDYVIFSDGDCVPRWDFVATHLRLARPWAYLSGGYLKLPRPLSERLTYADVVSGRAFDRRWLRAQGWRPGRRRWRLLRSARWAAWFDRLTPTRATWNGHNASTWRELLLAVNGFDLDMGYGGEDRAIGERLRNLGVRGIQIRHRAPVLHLDHPRPYLDPAVLARNRAIRRRIRRQREIRARQGLAELPSEPVRVVRYDLRGGPCGA